MKNAVSAVKNGMPTLRFSKQFGVPRTTLLDNVDENVKMETKNGLETVVKQEEESLLVKWMFHEAKCGFTITKKALLESVQKTPPKDFAKGNTFNQRYMVCYRVEIKKYIDDNNLVEVWNDFKKIFNCGESAF